MSYDKNAYLNFERGRMIPCFCDYCKKNFEVSRRNITIIRKRGQKLMFCNQNCFHRFNSTASLHPCKECGKEIFKIMDKRCLNSFCSKSCAATYNNKHKTKGNRRSKLESWLEVKLAEIYPNLELRFNKKDTINSELDLYIPSLKLAFEFNGIFHYEPIFGGSKLNQIKNNDNRKFQACLERNIELCIIDTSSQKYVKPSTSQKFLDIVIMLVNSKLESSKTDYVEVL